MKITKIERQEDTNIFHVTFSPNWIERIFNVKQKVKKYKDTGSEFTFGGGSVYINENLDQLPNGSHIGNAIDKSRMKW